MERLNHPSLTYDGQSASSSTASGLCAFVGAAGQPGGSTRSGAPSSQGSNMLSSNESMSKFTRRNIRESQTQKCVAKTKLSDSALVPKNHDSSDRRRISHQSGLKTSLQHRSHLSGSESQKLASDMKPQYLGTRTTTATSGDGPSQHESNSQTGSTSHTTSETNQHPSPDLSSEEFGGANNHTDAPSSRATAHATLQLDCLRSSFTSIGVPGQSPTDTMKTLTSPLLIVKELPSRNLKRQQPLSFPSDSQSQHEEANTHTGGMLSQDSTPSTLNLLQSVSLPNHEAQSHHQQTQLNHGLDQYHRRSDFSNQITFHSNESGPSSDLEFFGADSGRSAVHRRIAALPSGNCSLPPSKCRSSSVEHSTAFTFNNKNSPAYHEKRLPYLNGLDVEPRHRPFSDSPFHLKQRLMARQTQLEQQRRLDDEGLTQPPSLVAHPTKDRPFDGTSPNALCSTNSDSMIESHREFYDDKNTVLETPMNMNGAHDDGRHSQSTPGIECHSMGVTSLATSHCDAIQLDYGGSKVQFADDDSTGRFKRKNLTNDNAAPPRPNKTKSQLIALQEKIVKFEEQLQIESEHRKAAGECKLNVLKDALGALEKTLAAEVRRRLEANKTIQIGLEQQLAELEEKVDQTLEEQSKQATLTVETLTSKLKVAETGAREAIEIQAQRLRQLADDIQITASESHKIKEHITNEFQARRQRSEIIKDKLIELEKQIESRVNIEKSVRERDVRKLKGAVEELKGNHIALDDSFQQELADKFKELKNALREETQAREQADDDIVQALNYYTLALQSALSIANSA